MPLAPGSRVGPHGPGNDAGGLILGTAAYMAPEQARGKAVGRRADIWAFGVVLYELVTGTRPFGGDNVTDTIAAVVKEQPDLGKVPPSLRRLITRCLEKDPAKQLRDIGEAWESPIASSTSLPTASTKAFFLIGGADA
jgi:serine/threonine protein kinase